MLNQRLKVQRTRFDVGEDVGFLEPFFSIAEEGYNIGTLICRRSPLRNYSNCLIQMLLSQQQSKYWHVRAMKSRAFIMANEFASSFTGMRLSQAYISYRHASLVGMHLS
jgi:hypothetical protein